MLALNCRPRLGGAKRIHHACAQPNSNRLLIDLIIIASHSLSPWRCPARTPRAPGGCPPARPAPRWPTCGGGCGSQARDSCSPSLRVGPGWPGPPWLMANISSAGRLGLLRRLRAAPLQRPAAQARAGRLQLLPRLLPRLQLLPRCAHPRLFPASPASSHLAARSLEYSPWSPCLSPSLASACPGAAGSGGAPGSGTRAPPAGWIVSSCHRAPADISVLCI